MSRASGKQQKTYVLDTNVLIHDPTSILNFEEHQVIIPITVLEELDQLKSSKHAYAADCRSAIRMIDQVIGEASPEDISKGVAIHRDNDGQTSGSLAVLMTSQTRNEINSRLPNDLNDNKIINRLIELQEERKDTKVILVTKDINMRLKARSCGLESEDYHNDQLVSDIKQLTKGYIHIPGSFWDVVDNVNSSRVDGKTYHLISRQALDFEVYANEFVVDETGFVGRFQQVKADTISILDLSHHGLLERQAWGLRPRNMHQALALNLLLDTDVHLVTLTGAAGSGKTILALAAALEMTVENKLYNKIIVTRSTPPLAEEHGFLPGTEEEKMDPWLGAISDNIEALHSNDERPQDSIAYVKNKANIQFKAMNYIRGRSFQKSLIIIDECQNLTPYQMKAILTRAGEGSKVICLGNLAQIDTPYLNPISSGLTYMTERFKGFAHGGSVQLNGVPRSILAEFAESNL
ncbi:MAG: PhoH family protein [Gammaproteobacteria bacterium]|jgi:PhoH-like ATPase